MPRATCTVEEAVQRLAEAASPDNRQGMARFSIDTSQALGVSMPDIRAVAGTIMQEHGLAEQLWRTGLHEARILAGFVDRPKWVDEAQMERWTGDFTSWDLCDQICGNLWDRAEPRDRMITRWHEDQREFVRRAAFATIAWRAVHDKKAPDAAFGNYFALIEAAADDNRNFVKKAVNWALRQMGKRSAALHARSVELASLLAGSTSVSAQWIGRDALRELQDPKVTKKLGLDEASR